MIDNLAKRLKKASSAPKITDGRRITAFGNFSNIFFSPSLFDLAYLLIEFSSAPRDDT